MCITKTDFKWIFGINSSEMEMANNINPDSYALYSKMKNLTMSRKTKICEFVNKNTNFSKLTESQKVQLNLFLRLVEVKRCYEGKRRNSFVEQVDRETTQLLHLHLPRRLHLLQNTRKLQMASQEAQRRSLCWRFS
jgi:hypothetical protein